MPTRIITLWRVHITSLTTSVSTMRFLIEIMFVLKAIKSHFKGSYDKQNLTLVLILKGVNIFMHYMSSPLGQGLSL